MHSVNLIGVMITREVSHQMIRDLMCRHLEVDLACSESLKDEQATYANEHADDTKAQSLLPRPSLNVEVRGTARFMQLGVDIYQKLLESTISDAKLPPNGVILIIDYWLHVGSFKQSEATSCELVA